MEPTGVDKQLGCNPLTSPRKSKYCFLRIVAGKLAYIPLVVIRRPALRSQSVGQSVRQWVKTIRRLLRQKWHHLMSVSSMCGRHLAAVDQRARIPAKTLCCSPAVTTIVLCVIYLFIYLKSMTEGSEGHLYYQKYTKIHRIHNTN